MLLIKNIRLIDPASGRDENTDILADETGVIKLSPGGSIEPGDLDEDTLMIDGTDLVACPGLVDVHVHFRDPGFEYKEDIETGALAAAAGGFTSVVCMANTKPAADCPEVIGENIKKGEKTGIHVYQAATVTKGMQGKELTDFDALKKAGACGFTDDGVPILDAALAKAAMEEAARHGAVLSFHEEDPAYIENNGINRGSASRALGIGGSGREAEISMIERDVALAKETGAVINIQHISTAEGVDLIRKAVEGDESGRKIHAEATPHHFTLTEEAVKTYGSLAKMNPPLRTEEDRMAIIAGLKDDTIDIIATDHAPHSEEEKAREITQAPSGITGLQTSLALGISSLVKPGHLTLPRLIEKMSLNPAKLYGLDAGCIREGGPADITVFDPDEEWVFERDMVKSKSANTPFIGMSLTGRVKATICGGVIVYYEQ
ncbi:MAG: dihydroorotase [Lachnospiraceae bacterium]|nr:dihydroorotase [Lachnospiraceae bacterium]